MEQGYFLNRQCGAIGYLQAKLKENFRKNSLKIDQDLKIKHKAFRKKIRKKGFDENLYHDKVL